MLILLSDLATVEFEFRFFQGTNVNALTNSCEGMTSIGCRTSANFFLAVDRTHVRNLDKIRQDPTQHQTHSGPGPALMTGGGNFQANPDIDRPQIRCRLLPCHLAYITY
jgi:hypothetical protein